MGVKGTWSHTELHALRLRLQGAQLHKARQGELRGHPPTGYIDAPSGAWVLDPDESGVAAVRLLCAQVNAWGSAFRGMRSFAAQRRPVPRRPWGPLGLGRLLAILPNPPYTGASVYGRRRSQPIVVAGQVVRVRPLPRPQAPWTVVIQGAHPASLSWED